MTIAIKGNSQGGVIEAGGVPAANISANGFPFMKNKLINGEVTRINQRGVANWAAVANGAYGYDRWKKINASNMTQIIEAGNFRPSTVHTLSGVGVTTQQITSPASGNWTLPNIPITATNVQVEEGLEATPFEVRHIAFELALCQRYYEIGFARADFWPTIANQVFRFNISFATTKRTTAPTLLKTGDLVTVNTFNLSITIGTVGNSGATATVQANTSGTDTQGAFTWSASAEL